MKRKRSSKLIKILSLPTVLQSSGVTEINTTAPAITPTYGSNRLTATYNPDFEKAGTWTGGVAPSWTKSSTPTCTQETTTIHGGSNSQKVVGDDGGVYNASGGATIVGVWYRFSAYVYLGAGKARIDGTAGSNVLGNSATLATLSTWTDVFFTNRALTTDGDGPYINIQQAGTTMYVDDAANKTITFSSMRALVGTMTRKNTTYVCHPTAPVGIQVGMLIEYVDDNNFIMALIDRAQGKGQLLTRVAGTFTSKVNANITYSAGAELKIIASGTTYQLWYNGAQVGTNQTISDTLGSGVYAFSSDASGDVGTVTTNPT